MTPLGVYVDQKSLVFPGLSSVHIYKSLKFGAIMASIFKFLSVMQNVFISPSA